VIYNMVKKIELYECETCKKRLPSYEEAEKHEKIKETPSLPIGLVLRYSGLSLAKRFLVITDGGNLDREHCYINNALILHDQGTKLFIQGTGEEIQINSRSIRKTVQNPPNDAIELLNDGEFDTFKRKYDLSDEFYVQGRIGLKADGLTNKI
jgi:hypothetical protein